METQKICPNCRKPLPPDVPLGLCPECLIKSGFPTEGGTGVSGETAGARFVPPPVEEIAQLFPQLEILGYIGKGGMGAVYKARQPTLDRLVALKVLPPAVAGDSGFAERFNREARALARLSHPNIVAVHDFGKAGPLHYLLMEFVDGTSLREVEQAGKLSPEQALAIVPKICEALQYAHDQGVVHRDIKPENILLDKQGRVKIADFGIAKIVGQGTKDVSLTGAKDVVGTPHYMAPEQIEKPQTVDHRADIYSLGVVFYEMLTGELPLGKFAPPSKKVEVDVRLDEVVLHALEKEPSRRYQQASQVKTDVETITGTPPLMAGFAAKPPVYSNPADQTTSDKALLPAFLLAFFFGIFGAHRFYVGKTGTAFLQLFTLGGLGIWAVIDWILILCKAFTDGQGRRITHWIHPATGINDRASQPPPPIPSPAANTGMIVAPAVGLMVAALWKLLPAMTALFFLSGHTQWLELILGRLGIGSFLGKAGVGLVLFNVVPALLILFGSFQMSQLRSYAWSVAAAILSIVACSLIGLPIGIWALIVLARPDVRETFANAARSGAPRTNPWPWVLGMGLVAGALFLFAIAFGLAGRTSTVTVNGIITDAVTGQPIAGARVDDNRYGANSDEAPAQVWTDANGHYELKTWYEEHTIAASAPGYEPKLSTLRTKIFGSERNVSVNFSLQPETLPPLATSAGTNGSSSKETTSTSLAPATSTTSATTNTAPARMFQPVRIKAGSSKPIVDHDGNLWLPDQGFAGGQTIERPQLAIVNTTDPELYQSERYGMTSFSYPVPNGKYLVKLHFAETYNTITGPGERVFTFIVEGREFKDFDVWAEAGGAQRACVKTVSAEVTDGMLDIYFIPQQQNPQINGIEILPASPIAIAKTPSPPEANKPPVASSVHREKIIANLSTTDPFQQEFNRTLPLSANGRLSLDNVNGRIEIAGWDWNEVSIKALKHGQTRESVEAVQINIDSSPDEIVIHTKRPKEETGFSWSQFWSGDWGRNDVTVDYLLQVPRHAHLGKIESVNGQVEIEGITGDIEASAVNGGVRVRGAGGNLKLSNVNGRIEAELDSLGNDQFVALDTVNGQIEASLPSNADAKVTASTMNGSLSSEFPALVVKNEFPLGKNLKGTLGNGSASVKANTVNGGIRFRQNRNVQ